MIEIKIPGGKKLEIKFLLLDYNGTIAVDGEIIGGVKKRFVELGEKLEIHVVTADTFGKARSLLADTPCKLEILEAKDQDQQKKKYLKRLGSMNTVCFGNGRNDRLMLKEAGLGIGVILEEGAFSGTLLEADVVCNSIISALDLLLFPKRLQATLRN